MRKKPLVAIVSVALVCGIYGASGYAADLIESGDPYSSKAASVEADNSAYTDRGDASEAADTEYEANASNNLSVTNSNSSTNTSASVSITNNGKEEVSWSSNDPNSSYSATVKGPNNSSVSVSVENKSTNPNSKGSVSVSSRSSSVVISTNNSACSTNNSQSTSGGCPTTIPQPPATQNSANAKEVTVEILGGVISSRSAGLLRVVLYGSPSFDATSIDQASLRLAGASVHELRDPFVDVNADDIKDAVLYFEAEKLNVQPGDTQVTLTGTTTSGQAFKGSATVRVLEFER